MNPTILPSKHSRCDNDVLRYRDIDTSVLKQLLRRYGLQLSYVEPGTKIPGSYWGDEEAGLIEDRVFVRDDTPLHSILHESCHYICMEQQRRDGVHTDAGGDYDEENAVCYLQILLSERIPEFGSSRMFADMDRWGYTFRLGSARAWFENDAEDARQYLLDFELIDRQDQPVFKLRQ